MDVIGYSLTASNPSSATVFNAVFVDFLPPASEMTYQVGSASNGGVYDPAANTITWTIPEIAPGGTVILSYQIQAGFESANSKLTTLDNKAQVTYPNGIVTASNSVTVSGSYVIHLAIYNQSGEKIRDLVTFESGTPIEDFTVVNGTLLTDSASATFLYDNLPLGSWDGTNGSGQKVTNGTYMVKIDSTDPYGVTSTVTHSVVVNIDRNTLEIAVYNSVGEVVKHFTQEEIQSLIAGVNGSLLPADFDVGKASLSSKLLSPSYANVPGTNHTVTITLGSGRSFTWDGKGDNGQILSTGDYFVEVKSSMSNQPDQEIVMNLHIQDSAVNGAGTAALWPNPINLNQTSQAKFMLNVGVDVTHVQVRVYTIAGELMKTLQNDQGNPNQVTWDFTGSYVARGAYLAVVEFRSDTGILSRKIIKILILH
jgi:uncharacterized repeat protein (TIGR01451 family)